MRKKKRERGGGIIVFDNIVSPHAQTTLSLRKVLTYLNYENEKILKKSIAMGI